MTRINVRIISLLCNPTCYYVMYYILLLSILQLSFTNYHSLYLFKTTTNKNKFTFTKIQGCGGWTVFHCKTHIFLLWSRYVICT